MATPELATTLAEPTDQDRLLQAEAVVRNYCGWHIAPVRTDTVSLLWPQEDTAVVLPTLRLVAVTGVVDSDGNTLDPGFYSSTTQGVLVRTYAWSPLLYGWGYMTVTFTHGYTEVPADVTAAVVNLAKRLRGGSTALLSKTIGPFSESYTPDLLGLDRSVLDRYKLPPRP